jgi:hypothetical protein
MPVFVSDLNADEVVRFRQAESLAKRLFRSRSRRFFLKECVSLGLTPTFAKVNGTLQSHSPESSEVFARSSVRENLVSACKSVRLLENRYLESRRNLDIRPELLPFVEAHLESLLSGPFDSHKVERLFVTEYASAGPIISESVTCLTDVDLTILGLGPKFVFQQPFKESDIHFMFEQAATFLNADDSRILSGLRFELANCLRDNKRSYKSKLVSQLQHKIKDNNLVVVKADKECRLVVMTRDEYVAKVESVLSDRSKFELYCPPPPTRGRPKINNLFEQLAEEVDEFVESIPNLESKVELHGLRQPFLYGLAKSHKPGMPIRPVLSATGCYNFSLASFLAKAIKSRCYSDYCIPDMFQFVKEYVGCDFSKQVLASFDVVSLYTNIPLTNTVDLLLDDLFANSDCFEFDGVSFSREEFEKALELAVCNQHFLFDGKVYI